MSRRNEIKNDLWRILREVYCISEYREITDKQNEFLNKAVEYLEDNISLRRKGEKKDADETAELEPLARPLPTKMPEPIVAVTSEEPKKEKKERKKTVEAAPKAKVATGIDLSALPAHLRKYAITN